MFMAKQGCNLILHGRTKEHCAAVLEEVKALGVQAHAVGAEFSELSQVSAMLAEIDSLGVDVDIVLNNAGIQVAYRTDLGGPHAPNAPESALPGVVVGAFVDDRRSGRNLSAGNFYGLTLSEAVAKAENGFPVYTGSGRALQRAALITS